MDARVDDGVVTPRHGKAVEINALWHHALYVMHSFSHQLGQPEKAARFLELANHVKESFNQKFWNPISGCLYDCIQGDIRNGQIRPNQLIALSLPTPLVSEERARSILQVVQEKLLTPFGLRSLAPDDPAYRNLYAGNSYQRDSAYHQGTVWPWLLGPYIDGYLFAYGTSPQTVTNLLSLLDPFKRHLQEAMLGSISEIFDPEPPYTPKGCGAQAWSVAELLRVYQKLKNLQPKTA
jgi:glycogen debranching enzyme